MQLGVALAEADGEDVTVCEELWAEAMASKARRAVREERKDMFKCQDENYQSCKRERP